MVPMFIVSSKTFGTLETLTNALIRRYRNLESQEQQPWLPTGPCSSA
jgi:glucose-6-phosphate isomerase